jgi:hypothetical protein
MFNFNKVQSPKKINRDFILSRISEAQIFGYYHGPFEIGQIYCSKLRRDRNPSCGFYISKAGKIIYNDLGRKDWSFDCFSFVEKLYNLSFSDAIKKIATDFGLVTGIQSPEVKKVVKQLKDFDKSFKKDTRIHFSTEPWNDDNLAFWKQYHITKQELEREGIYSIKKLFINDSPISNPNNENRYALTETIKGDMRTKIYAPDSENLRWISNIPLDVPFGMTTLKPAKFCFVAKAQKDRIILMKFLKSVIASQNESEGAMDSVSKSLLFNYQDVYLGWDPDEKGLSEMAALKEKGFTPLHLPIDQFETEGIKDYADLCKEKGLGAVEQFLKQNNLI